MYMNKIYILLAQLLLILIPKYGNALKTVTDYQDDVGGFSAFQFNSPILMILNISAFIVLTLSIIWFMKGYTIKDLSSGNIKEIKNGDKLMSKSYIGLIYIIIVFIIDLSVY